MQSLQLFGSSLTDDSSDGGKGGVFEEYVCGRVPGDWWWECISALISFMVASTYPRRFLLWVGMLT